METYNPVSTYRLQFNRDFTLNDAETILPYLWKLGIKTIYASPVLTAVKGSNHGYDVTDPLKINPEIGTAADFERLLKRVHDYKMGWIQDIVPNHMAFSTENPWIYDVLEKGKNSEYYKFFDILKTIPTRK
jgi:(1->4)-alpha-D-glucan 1-alpha-D-glucosylmutase